VTQQFCDANHRSEDGDDIDYGGARNDGKDDKTPAFFADYSSDRFDLGFEPELCLPQLGPDRDLRPQLLSRSAAIARGVGNLCPEIGDRSLHTVQMCPWRGNPAPGMTRSSLMTRRLRKPIFPGS
jgi:hypothetical protein